jgi:hypothetical protein
MPSLYRTPGTTLANKDLNPLNIGAFESIVGHNMKMLFVRV